MYNSICKLVNLLSLEVYVVYFPIRNYQNWVVKIEYNEYLKRNLRWYNTGEIISGLPDSLDKYKCFIEKTGLAGKVLENSIDE